MESVRGAVLTSKQEITETGRFMCWLAERELAIGACRQSDVDPWLAEGPTTRHAIRRFIVWARKHKVAPALTVAFRQPRSTRLITQDDRLAWLGQCLAGTPDTLAYRVAAVLLLLFAQPLVRVAALRTDDILFSPTELRIRLGSEPTAVPEPFATLLRDHLGARPNLRTANSSGSPWPFPSTRAGQDSICTRAPL